MNALLFERPIWFATGPLEVEEEAQEMEDFTYHRPVLVAEAVELLAPRAGALVVDATCGGGGHTEEILRTGADVLAFDQDPDAIEHASERLAPYGGRVTLRQINFRDAAEVLDQLGIVGIGGALLDLGVSSRQLENAERGFSVMRNGPLDMRMDPRRELHGRDDRQLLLGGRPDAALPRPGRRAGRAAHCQPVGQTAQDQLRSTTRCSWPRPWRKSSGGMGAVIPATQVFQALRMEVNDELGALEEGLRVLTARLESGARIAVITFHSLEDRIVKNFFRDRSRELLDRPEWPEPRPNPDFALRLITSKPVEPGENEQRVNPRSRSAKLRVAEKI